MPDVLIVADTIRSPELRHEVPIDIGDPFLYAEVTGGRHAVVSALEVSRVEELPGDLVVHTFEEYDYESLLEQGLGSHELWPALWVSAAKKLGLTQAVVPLEFPLGHAERLREAGVEVRVDQPFFDARRRVKNEVELDGIRRACRAVEAGMARGVEMLRAADRSNGGLTFDGEPLTCERIRAELERVFGEQGAVAESFTVSHGSQTAIGHDPGSGQIADGDTVLFDLYPRDRETACFADFTRTVTVGPPSEEIALYHRLSKEALDLAVAMVRPGVDGRDIHRAVCDYFHEHGQKTQLHKAPGEVLRDGYFHGTGHGVGLEVHEEPSLGRLGGKLVAGDVVAVEPGLYRHGYGGVRLEDLLLVTDDGAEVLTDFPYDLEL
jgi:Xaa-Pro aminopeptidase